MRYIFFGSYEIAPHVLEKLLEHGLNPIALVCNPDKPMGRKKALTPPATKRLIHEKGLQDSVPVLQPEKLDSDFQNAVIELKPDFFVVAAYGKIIPQRILDIAPRGTLGVHPSLLPKYRGPSPMKSALLAGETGTGVVIYLIDAEMDHGPVLATERYSIEPIDTSNSLVQNLGNLGGELLAKTITLYLEGKVVPQEQNHDLATYTKKFNSDDGFIDPEDIKKALSGSAHETAILIDRKIRALNPEPGVWTMHNGKRIKLLQAHIQNSALQLDLIQTEGKKPISAQNITW